MASNIFLAPAACSAGDSLPSPLASIALNCAALPCIFDACWAIAAGGQASPQITIICMSFERVMSRSTGISVGIQTRGATPCSRIHRVARFEDRFEFPLHCADDRPLQARRAPEGARGAQGG